MVREANAGGRKATGDRDNVAAPSSGRRRANWPDTGVVPPRKGADERAVGCGGKGGRKDGGGGGVCGGDGRRRGGVGGAVAPPVPARNGLAGQAGVHP